MSKRIQRNKIASSLSEFRPKKIRIRQNNHQSSEFEGDDVRIVTNVNEETLIILFHFIF